MNVIFSFLIRNRSINWRNRWLTWSTVKSLTVLTHKSVMALVLVLAFNFSLLHWWEWHRCGKAHFCRVVVVSRMLHSPFLHSKSTNSRSIDWVFPPCVDVISAYGHPFWLLCFFSIISLFDDIFLFVNSRNVPLTTFRSSVINLLACIFTFIDSDSFFWNCCFLRWKFHFWKAIQDLKLILRLFLSCVNHHLRLHYLTRIWIYFNVRGCKLVTNVFLRCC